LALSDLPRKLHKGSFARSYPLSQDRIDRIGPGLYIRAMEVRLLPEVQAKLDRMATQSGRDTESLVREAVERLVDYDEWFIREVEQGLAQIERGEVLEHEEVGARVRKLLLSKKHKRV
jgi:predicted transcriptional regulator